MNEEFAALETFLLPFKNLFAEDGINEIMVNKPGEAWVEKKAIYILSKYRNWIVNIYFH